MFVGYKWQKAVFLFSFNGLCRSFLQNCSFTSDFWFRIFILKNIFSSPSGLICNFSDHTHSSLKAWIEFEFTAHKAIPALLLSHSRFSCFLLPPALQSEAVVWADTTSSTQQFYLWKEEVQTRLFLHTSGDLPFLVSLWVLWTVSHTVTPPLHAQCQNSPKIFPSHTRWREQLLCESWLWMAEDCGCEVTKTPSWFQSFRQTRAKWLVVKFSWIFQTLDVLHVQAIHIISSWVSVLFF